MHAQQTLQADPPPQLPNIDGSISSFDRILLRPDIHVEIRIETSARRIRPDQALALFCTSLINALRTPRDHLDHILKSA